MAASGENPAPREWATRRLDELVGRAERLRESYLAAALDAAPASELRALRRELREAEMAARIARIALRDEAQQ